MGRLATYKVLTSVFRAVGRPGRCRLRGGRGSSWHRRAASASVVPGNSVRIRPKAWLESLDEPPFSGRCGRTWADPGTSWLSAKRRLDLSKTFTSCADVVNANRNASWLIETMGHPADRQRGMPTRTQTSPEVGWGEEGELALSPGTQIPTAYFGFVQFEVDGRQALSGLISAYPPGPDMVGNSIRTGHQQARQAPRPLEVFDIRAQLGRGSSRFAFILLFSRALSCDPPRLERLVVFEMVGGRPEYSWNEADGVAQLSVLATASCSWTRVRFSLATTRSDRTLRATVDATIRDVRAPELSRSRDGARALVLPSLRAQHLQGAARADLRVGLRKPRSPLAKGRPA